MILLALLATSAVSSGPDEAVYAPRVQDWFAENLKDPSTAQIRPWRPIHYRQVVTGGLLNRQRFSGYWVCYKINAKNSYGAFTGVQEYAIQLTWDGYVQAGFSDALGSAPPDLVDKACDEPD